MGNDDGVGVAVVLGILVCTAANAAFMAKALAIAFSAALVLVQQ